MKKTLFALAFTLASIVAVKAQKQEVYAPNGTALNGYDAVAFFKQSKPVKGADNLSYTYKDVKWLFSTQDNLDAFKANPEHYCPQYGGYCAFGMAEGHKAPTQPDTWTVLNDKLYFNYNLKVKSLWTKEQAANIAKADKNWPDLKDKQ